VPLGAGDSEHRLAVIAKLQYLLLARLPPS
jgi:hypothetical protein